MNTLNVTSNPRFLYRPKNIFFLVCIIVVLWAIMRDSLSTLIILALTALIIMGIKKPLWAMGALIISQLTLTDFLVPLPFVSISLRLLLLVIIFIIVAKSLFSGELKLGPGARKLIIPMLIFILVTVIANFANIGFDLAFKDFRNLLVGFSFAIFLVAIIQDAKQLKTLGALTVIVITISAIIGIMQHFNILGMANATVYKGWMLNPFDKRIPGIGETELELSYILSAAFIIILCLYFYKGVSSSRRLILLSMILMLPALYFTYTRSALFAVGLALLSLVLFLKTHIKWQIILVILFLVIFFFVQTDILGKSYFSGRSETSQLESTVSRDILWQAAIGIALDYPVLGIGANQFIIVSPRYASSVDPSLIQWENNRYWSWQTLGTLEPHNDYLNVWVSYGTIALVIYIWLHFAILRNLGISFRKAKGPFLKGMSLGLAGALITWVANSFYHNITGTLPLLWMLAGFSMVLVKLTANNKDSEKKQLNAKNPSPGL
jgi:O-antigen ligase